MIAIIISIFTTAAASYKFTFQQATSNGVVFIVNQSINQSIKKQPLSKKHLTTT